jgi:hypothetical protein
MRLFGAHTLKRQRVQKHGCFAGVCLLLCSCGNDIESTKDASLCVRGDRVPSKPLRLSIEDSANVRLEGFLVKPIVRFCVRIERSTKSCLIVRVRVLPLLDAGS